jgi:hypothetical protein
VLGNAERLDTCRARLGSLAWFMRSLNEPIARRANREDACTGRFWEGRYKCQALLDDAAVLTCMSYVDLNPVRAGVAESLEASAHTSALHRIASIKSEPDSALRPLSGVATKTSSTPLPLTVADYLEVIDWTARQKRADKRGAVSTAEPPILRKLGLTEHQWSAQMLGTETRYWRAIGSAQSLIEKAVAMGQSWMKGISVARSLMRSQPT